MPIIKSAIKRAKQNIVRRDKNKHYKTMMLTFYKKIKNFVTN
jgi:ribosomal protein S20